jgi:hypothetical protein
MPIDPVTSDRPNPRAAAMRPVDMDKSNGGGTAAPAPAPPPPDLPKNVTIHLKWKKVRSHEGEVDKLVFREPTIRDLMDYGIPVKIIFEQGRAITEFEPVAMTQMLAALGVVAPMVIEQMDPRDWISAAWGVSRFFVPDFGTLS